MLVVPGEPAQKPVANLRGVGPARKEQLSRLGIRTISDLLLHLPLRYEDWRPPADPRARAPATFALRGEITGFGHRGTGGVPRTVVDVRSGSVDARAVLFGRRWLAQKLRSGVEVSIYGEWESRRESLRSSGGQISLSARSDIRPVYPTTEGLSSGMIEKLVVRALDEVVGSVSPVLPANLRRRRGLMPFPRAVRAVHRPTALKDAERARLSLAFIEFLLFHIALRAAGRARRQEPGTAHDADPVLSSSFIDFLPFQLTDAQRRAMGEIKEDMRASRRMHRLLQGDVASGKTVVAAWASLLAVESGMRALWLVPTRLLAEQHRRTLGEYMDSLKLSISSLTAEDEESGDNADVIVGTHSLLDRNLQRVGLLVIDEQQRFGVQQRAKLQRAHPCADVLLMSATPIPRTLAGVMLGGVSVSTIDERPEKRGGVTTEVVAEAHREEILLRVQSCVRSGGGVYVICPSIDDSGEGVRSVESAACRIAGALPRTAVAAVHGRMSGEERRNLLSQFAAGDIDILVGTTVLEVGLDIPRAQMMVVENAERFGLAELHQLRGRIGRGQRRGHCCLILTEGASPEARERLHMLQRTDDGTEIAMADMKLRGIGDFFSAYQHGMPRLIFSRYLTSSRFQCAVTEAADVLMHHDPQLNDHQAMRRLLLDLYAESLSIASVL